jgi:uncharacterized membrane protein SpoIIM required for sporulation
MRSRRDTGFFSGLYSRNETLLWTSAGIFLGSIIISYLFAGMLDAILAPLLQSFQKKASEGAIKLETLSIFLNNVNIAFFIYIGGILIGIVTAFLMISNGAFIGYVASKYPLGDFLIYTIPHGIFEVTGIIIAGTAGFRLGSAVLNYLNGVTKLKNNISYKNQLIYLFEANMEHFKDSLILFIIAVILLLIGAFIEANLSVAWGQFIQSTI